ncbi:hypothetical protein DICPUDRAFT_153916 [Dictyostelium purpureum]|uniref:Cytidine deaminase n=1 Tax=Dictyostelium purpureum TaxID=5786 RepID=F0ZQ28_DICPU|nr:uncharacterized protein DICPUDRAFT_153916 [Dictyostelium purpureum]EGC33950.1 hypothetical protein DICPUDRAFT_153916 [Dictyostelium purpureum]|eukprot:XP_003289532.1 hypothetical protein DICPUDRAFT_153916 [Dictyostelium purpureum]
MEQPQYKLTDEELSKCMDAAYDSLQYSYSPYSKFRVGAALLGTNDKIYTGVNVENSSYGLTICAERTAYTKAVSEGCTTFKGIIVVSDATERFTTPCGACRQFGVEFGNFEVVCCKPDRTSFRSSTFGFLPGCFTQVDLDLHANQNKK